jgi:hypothetical protein
MAVVAPPVYRAALDGTEMVRVLKGGRWYLAPVTAVAALYDAAGLTARLAALEARPEEAAHFTAAAKLPALSVLAPVSLTLTGLKPARAGDVLRAGETVLVEPATALPAGVNLSAAFVPVDGAVSLQLTASLSVAAGAAPIAWNITALR